MMPYYCRAYYIINNAEGPLRQYISVCPCCTVACQPSGTPKFKTWPTAAGWKKILKVIC